MSTLSFVFPTTSLTCLGRVSQFPLCSLSLLPLRMQPAFVVKHSVICFIYTSAVKSTPLDTLMYFMGIFKDFIVSRFFLQCLSINQINCFRRTWGIAHAVRWYWTCKDLRCCNTLGKKSFARQLIRGSE